MTWEQRSAIDSKHQPVFSCLFHRKTWQRERESHAFCCCAAWWQVLRRVCLLLGAGEVQALFPGFATNTSSWPTHLFFSLGIPHIQKGKKKNIVCGDLLGEIIVPCKLQNHHIITKWKPPLAVTVWSTWVHQSVQPAPKDRQTWSARKCLVRFDFQSSFF